MDAQELRNLQEAYLGVYASQKELNERLRRFPGDKVWAKQEKIQDRLSNPKLSRQKQQTLSRRWSDMDDVRQDMQNPRLPISQHTPQGSRVKSLANKNRPESEKRSKTVEPIRRFPNRLMRGDRQGIHDSYDFYDIILSHLLDEGYAETPEAAEAIMVNMSEEWRDSILG